MDGLNWNLRPRFRSRQRSSRNIWMNGCPTVIRKPWKTFAIGWRTRSQPVLEGSPVTLADTGRSLRPIQHTVPQSRAAAIRSACADTQIYPCAVIHRPGRTSASKRIQRSAVRQVVSDLVKDGFRRDVAEATVVGGAGPQEAGAAGNLGLDQVMTGIPGQAGPRPIRPPWRGRPSRG
jgi:hypothetical protein